MSRRILPAAGGCTPVGSILDGDGNRVPVVAVSTVTWDAHGLRTGDAHGVRWCSCGKSVGDNPDCDMHEGQAP